MLSRTPACFRVAPSQITYNSTEEERRSIRWDGKALSECKILLFCQKTDPKLKHKHCSCYFWLHCYWSQSINITGTAIRTASWYADTVVLHASFYFHNHQLWHQAFTGTEVPKDIGRIFWQVIHLSLVMSLVQNCPYLKLFTKIWFTGSIFPQWGSE